MSTVPLKTDEKGTRARVRSRRGRFVVVPKQPPKRRTVTFRLATTDHERLETLKERTGAQTLSEVLLRALSVYDLLVEHLADGFALQIEPPEELVSEEEVEELERQLSYLIGSQSN